MKKIAAVMVLCVSLSANAEVFKCVDAEGKTVYQNTPCPSDKGYFVDLDKNTKVSIEEYKKNKEKEQERIKQEFEAAKKIEEQQNSYSSHYPDSTYSGRSYSGRSYSGGKTIHTGPRGGRYYYNSSGNKTYVSGGRRK